MFHIRKCHICLKKVKGKKAFTHIVGIKTVAEALKVERTARNRSFSLPIRKGNSSKTLSLRLQQKILQTLSATNPLKLSKSRAISMVKYLNSNI